MWTRGLQRLPWQLTCALFAMVASADVEAANGSTGVDYGGKISLQDSNGQNISTLVPISSEATIRNLGSELFLTTDQTYQNISDDDIAYISCNNDDYPGNIPANTVFTNVYQNHNISGVILYSTANDYCNYSNPTSALMQFPIYSMTNKADSQSLVDSLKNQPVSSKFFVKVVRSGGGGGGGNNNQDGQQNGQNPSQQNPLGPSPSTAVAMIILYSITGIITALFLVIIVTGAVRAHRHPDRYGPRDVLGRPRQSRARGLGRAILDTIPIVKFGDKEEPKPTDVELGSTNEARNVNAANGEMGAHNAETGTETREVATTDAPRDTTAEHRGSLDAGIAPAQPMATGAAATQNNSSSDEGLGCSICTDDFEKGQDIRVLPCNHKFHPDCVDPWLLNVSGTCPLCRVDLRPVTSNTSTENHDEDPDTLAPPLQSDNDVSHRRRSMLRDIVSFRSRPNASADERISALRRLREQRRNQSGDVASGSANASTDDVTRDRRSKRMSVRLSDVFSSRRRNGREESPAAAESSSSAAQQPRRDGSPGPSGSNPELPSSRQNQNEQQR